jgi:hypothetical protein
MPLPRQRHFRHYLRDISPLIFSIHADIDDLRCYFVADSIIFAYFSFRRHAMPPFAPLPCLLMLSLRHALIITLLRRRH